ncbi:hypothetical protein Z043_111446 [Scleropages formosus]|uniref:Uncharacterized protein n=1 Tax=Scleropages formosus TaxID=113540 RepID=A0A0P7YPD4_SCLFO|nr:hypothetical protein Z043_111446 [Scleropages formosus]
MVLTASVKVEGYVRSDRASADGLGEHSSLKFQARGNDSPFHICGAKETETNLDWENQKERATWRWPTEWGRSEGRVGTDQLQAAIRMRDSSKEEKTRGPREKGQAQRARTAGLWVRFGPRYGPLGWTMIQKTLRQEPSVIAQLHLSHVMSKRKVKDQQLTVGQCVCQVGLCHIRIRVHRILRERFCFQKLPSAPVGLESQHKLSALRLSSQLLKSVLNELLDVKEVKSNILLVQLNGKYK